MSPCLVLTINPVCNRLLCVCVVCVCRILCHSPAVVSLDICLLQPLWMTLPIRKREFTPLLNILFIFVNEAGV